MFTDNFFLSRSSNIIQNNLHYTLNTFKSVEKLTIKFANVKNVEQAGSIKKTVQTLSVHKSNLNKVSDILLCDSIHKESVEFTTNLEKWPKLLYLDLNDNCIHEIGSVIGLAPNIEKLNLSRNQLSSVDGLTKLPHLVSLNLSHNKFDEIVNLHMKLGKVVELDLSNNNLSSLEGFSKLYSLVSLNISSNNITDVHVINSISNLPCLEALVLNGNIVATVVDYRIKVLELFGNRCTEICLDSESTTQLELDKVRVLQALRAAKEGRIPTLDFSCPLPSIPYAPPDRALMANEVLPNNS